MVKKSKTAGHPTETQVGATVRGRTYGYRKRPEDGPIGTGASIVLSLTRHYLVSPGRTRHSYLLLSEYTGLGRTYNRFADYGIRVSNSQRSPIVDPS